MSKNLVSSPSSKSLSLASMANRKIKTEHYKLSDDEAQAKVLKILVIGTVVLTTLLFILLLLSYFAAHNTHIVFRVIAAFIAVVYSFIVAIVFKRRHFRLATVLTIGFYMLFAGFALWQWGIHIAFAILMLCITITLSGMMLGSWYAIYAALIVSVIILFVQSTTTLHLHLPDTSWQKGQPSKVGEAVGYCVMFIFLALTAWLFGRQMERSLYRERRAREQIEIQKKDLAIRLKQKTATLRALQLKEMQQLYKFAELGQLSTALFHDLANHLAVLSLDLEELSSPQSKHALDSAHTTMTYIEGLVNEMRLQLSNNEQPELIDISKKLELICNDLSKRFVKAGMRLQLIIADSTKNHFIYGDPTRFAQVMAVLINNAFDATKDSTEKAHPKVVVRANSYGKEIVITVADWGSGISPRSRRKIFRPFFGTKDEGMGIGLFITEQIVKTHFRGSISVIHLKNPTVFKVAIPLIDETKT